MRAIGARDGEEPVRFAAQLALARARAQAIGSEASTDRRQRQSRMLYAMLVDMDETDPAGAAAAWAAVRSGAEAPDDLDVIVGYHEGRVRLSLGEHETAARLFAPLLAPARSEYLGAIRDAEVEDRGEYFSKLSAHHAYALGSLGRWDESLRALDGARSLRLRQRAGLRASRRRRHACSAWSASSTPASAACRPSRRRRAPGAARAAIACTARCRARRGCSSATGGCARSSTPRFSNRRVSPPSPPSWAKARRCSR